MSELAILSIILAFLAALETVKVVVSIMALLKDISIQDRKPQVLSRPLFAIPCWGLEQNRVRFLPPSGREDVLDLNGQSGALILNGQEMIAVFWRRQEWRGQ